MGNLDHNLDQTTTFPLLGHLNREGCEYDIVPDLIPPLSQYKGWRNHTFPVLNIATHLLSSELLSFYDAKITESTIRESMIKYCDMHTTLKRARYQWISGVPFIWE